MQRQIDQANEIVHNASLNTSQKIRALDQLGWTNGEIARALGIRPQFASNVRRRSLVSGKRADSVPEPGRLVQTRVQLADDGRIVIPAQYRTALGLKGGDNLLLRLEDGTLRIVTPNQVIRSAQELVRQYVPEGRSLVEELFEERRGEAAR